MYPGQVSRLSEKTVASATTIVGDADLLLVTGSTQIETITKVGIGAQLLFLIPTAGSVVLGASGNIAVTQTMIINKVTVLIYSMQTTKWYPHALA